MLIPLPMIEPLLTVESTRQSLLRSCSAVQFLTTCDAQMIIQPLWVLISRQSLAYCLVAQRLSSSPFPFVTWVLAAQQLIPLFSPHKMSCGSDFMVKCRPRHGETTASRWSKTGSQSIHNSTWKRLATLLSLSFFFVNPSLNPAVLVLSGMTR